ncbi:MAG: four helix bundle protein [Planctomycetes bacterium]|nr:four helix bundle protein [Planctomycetota bacterium]
MKATCFEELDIWRIARELTNRIYLVTKQNGFAGDFELKRQVRRSSVSVMSNIAEGHERNGNPEFIQFLYIAKGSCGEARSQFYIAYDNGYISQTDFEQVIQLCKTLSVKISNLIAYLKNSGLKGSKYK